MRQIRTRRGAQLMDAIPLIPDCRLALHDGDQLLGEAGGELGAAGAGGSLAAHGVEDPHDGDAAAGARGYGLGQVEGLAAAGGAA